MSDQPKYTCWQDKEDVTAQVEAELANINKDVPTVAANPSVKPKPIKVAIQCSKGHEVVFEF
jgi:hypothetical protein